MIFYLLKIYARLAFIIFCRKAVVNKPHWLQAKGPILLAANHPNSFLDGVVMTLLFKHDVYSLARGDVFKNRRWEKLLRWLHLLPVYRTSEGVENLDTNYITFKTCQEIFRKNGIVIIFSEGGCVNEWKLRPLKKGTARLAVSCWQAGIDLTVVPVGFNYNAFRNFGKNIFVNFGDPIKKHDVLLHATDGKMFQDFNDQLKLSLKQLVFEIDPDDTATKKKLLVIPQGRLKKLFLAVPAFLGLLLHVPMYLPVKWLNKKYFDNDHFDSTITAILFIAYPFYVLLLAVIGLYFLGLLVFVGIIISMPFFAWSIVQLKDQLASWKPQ